MEHGTRFDIWHGMFTRWDSNLICVTFWINVHAYFPVVYRLFIHHSTSIIIIIISNSSSNSVVMTPSSSSSSSSNSSSNTKCNIWNMYKCTWSYLHHIFPLLAHLSRRFTRWAYSIPISPASVRPSFVRPSSTISKIFFSETAWPIKVKFYVERPWVLFAGSWSHDQDGRHAHIW